EWPFVRNTVRQTVRQQEPRWPLSTEYSFSESFPVHCTLYVCGLSGESMTTITRIFNFAAGPAILPLPVLEEAQRDLLTLPGVGMSVMEISHRSSTFEDILHKAISDIRELADVP